VPRTLGSLCSRPGQVFLRKMEAIFNKGEDE